jgi:hypothetical protein
MQYGNRLSAGIPKVGNRALVLSRTVSHRDWDGDAAPAARWRGRVLLPILLVIILAVAAIGLSPTTASICAKLQDFPCGP